MPSVLEAIRAARRRSSAPPAAARKALEHGPPLRAPGKYGRPIRSTWGVEQAIDRQLKASVLVYRGVMALASALGSVRWQAEVLDGKGWKPDPSHELQGFLDKPHAYFPRQDFNEVLAMFLVLAGNSLFQRTMASGKPMPGATRPRLLELTPLIPDGIEPIAHPTEWLAGYRYNRGGVRRDWTAEEILHFMVRDPGNLYWGLSPLKAANGVIRMDIAAVRWNADSFSNRAVSDGVLSTNQSLTETQYEEMLDQVYEQHVGEGTQHLPWVLQRGLTFTATDRSPVEMDFNESRKMVREDVLSSLGVPPVVAGYFEQATLANADASRRLFWEDQLIPGYVERVVGGLNSGVTPHFGDPKKLRIAYDISGIPALREDLIKKSVILNRMVISGTPYNHAIQELELDLPPIPGAGDVPFGLEQFKPQAAAAAAAPTDEPDPTVPGPATPQDVQVTTASVLNGAQISAATDIVEAVANGDIPRDAGLGQLVVLFNLTDEQAAQIMGSAGTDTPTTPNPKPWGVEPQQPPPLQAPPPQPGEDEDEDDEAPKRGRKAAGPGVAVSSSVFTTAIADAAEPGIREAFAAIVRELRADAALVKLREALAANAGDAAAEALGAHRLEAEIGKRIGDRIAAVARQAAARAAELLRDQVGETLALDAGRLTRWLAPYSAERTAQLAAATRRAIAETVADYATGRLGTDLDTAAELVRGIWGLHGQQAAGVRNLYATLVEQGKSPGAAVEQALKLARVRLAERAAVIAAHEAFTAANRGNAMLWEQALDEGKVSALSALWVTADDADVDEDCLALEGREINYAAGERFPAEPPLHPGCRCGIIYSAITGL